MEISWPLIHAPEPYLSRRVVLEYDEVAYGAGVVALFQVDDLEIAQTGYSVDTSGRFVAPMTTNSRATPFRIGVTHGGQKGLILLDQMRAVNKTRLAMKLGMVSAKTLTSALNTLQEASTE